MRWKTCRLISFVARNSTSGFSLSASLVRKTPVNLWPLCRSERWRRRRVPKLAAQWERWTPLPMWEEAFSGYTIKKLQSQSERERVKKRPKCLSLPEMQVVWRLAHLPFIRTCVGLTFWCGHTQNEIVTLRFDHFVEDEGSLYIDRSRYKAGVPGRWCCHRNSPTSSTSRCGSELVLR